MKLLNEEEISELVCNECATGNDTPEMRKLITKQYWIYWYCYCVKDRKEMWSKIRDPITAYYYCKDVKYRKEVWRYA